MKCEYRIYFFILCGSCQRIIFLIMARLLCKNSDSRRESTVKRHNEIHDVYNDVIAGLGELARLVPKSYIYDKIKERTGLCTKTIAYILNHTRKTKAL